MKKRLDCKELTKEFNELRQNNLGKTFTGKELDQLLLKYGFSGYILAALKKQFAFDSYKVGNSKLFSFKKDPFHFDRMQDVLRYYNEHRTKHQPKGTPKELTEEEKAISLLRAQGYEMRKCIGFDLETFQKENPEMYKKYLLYETV